MKQLLKRSTALLLAVMFALMMPMTVLATTTATEDSNTVVVTSDTTTKVTVKVGDWYDRDTPTSLYKVLAITYNEDKNSLTYEFTDDFANFIKEYKGEDFTINDYCALEDEDINLILGKFTAYCQSNSIDPIGETTANSDGKAIFENVSFGQYVIVCDSSINNGSSETSKVYQNVTAEVVPFAQDGQYVIYENYDVVMKSTTPSITKYGYNQNNSNYVDTSYAGKMATASVGDTITFYVDVTIPKYPEGATNKTLIVGDNVSGGLKLVPDSMGVANISDECYTIECIGDSTMYVYFDYDKLAEYNIDSVSVSYDTVLTEYADIGDHNKNEAALWYTNAPFTGTTMGPSSSGTPEYNEGIYNMISAYSYVYSFALAVHKYDASTNESLEGAEFAVYDNEDCEGDPIATFTTNSDGYGGYAGLGAGTYYVVETKAPSGYKRNSTPQEVTIDLDHRASGYYQFTRNVIEYTSDINESLYGIQAKDDSYNLLWIDPNDTTQVYTSQSKNYVPAYVKSISYEVTDGNYGCEGCVVLEFPNAEGKTLPTTGDMGVVPFIIAGSALMVGAVIVLITRKRMNGEDKETL